MVKQAVDKVTREMTLTREWGVVSDAMAKTSEINRQLNVYLVKFNELMARRDDLESQGVDYAGTWWKEEKFLYLVYPDKGEGRKRVYIGADAKKQNVALDNLRRGREVEEIDKKIARMEMEVRHIGYRLGHALGGW